MIICQITCMFAIWISKRSLTVLGKRSVESHEVLGYDKKTVPLLESLYPYTTCAVRVDGGLT